MKIVIISQVCHPNLSPRGHRTTELAKEFGKRGHDVTVYALLGDHDYNSYTEKFNVKFKNLGKSHLGLVNTTGYRNTNIINKGIKKIIGKYIKYPDIELIPMVKKAIRSENKIDCLITIAVPHIIHYATALSDLKKVKTWIADCGDPFMGNPFHNHPKYFERFERKWCAKCDFITVPVEEAINGYYSEYHHKIKIIPQGFDFNTTELAKYMRNKVPTFAYTGAVYKDRRDPTEFLEYLSNIDNEFKFIVYTGSPSLFMKYDNILGQKLEIRSRIPREELLYELSKMQNKLTLSSIAL